VCGIAGVLDPLGATPGHDLGHLARAMADRLRHRGPDSGGVWVDETAGIAFGHRRLSILDLSPHGAQPMHSRCGRYTLVFNGEIYNHGHLRASLEEVGVRFRGHSDTEVLLAAVAKWGLETALERSNGMFALALWDHRERVLSLARDRLGEKPLYYGWAGRHLVFGSELKVLAAHPDFRPDVDRGALALYLRYNYVPSPYSIYRNVWKLPPATVVTLARPVPGALQAPEPFWRLTDVVDGGTRNRVQGTEEDAADELDSLLGEAVALRMHADVPLGAFLSGGVDSSTVVALMQAQSGRPVRTFTVAMPEAGFDESEDAAAVARWLGTDHTEVELSVSDALELVPTLPVHYDEPFSDPSGLPTSLVCVAARRHVTVSLSGDGGDEVFGGYNRYLYSRQVLQRLRSLPRPARETASRLLLALSPAAWDRAIGRLEPFLPLRLRVRNPGDKAQKLGNLLRMADTGDLYLALVSHWDGASPVEEGDAPSTLLDDPTTWPALEDLTEQMMFLDTAVSLPDDMLTKVDRASMSTGLEVRVPLLDHRVVEFAWRLPPGLKVGTDGGKHLLRRVLHRYVPASLIERPKMGFDPPLAAWLRGPLREWAECLLQERRLRDEGFLDPVRVREAWAEHVSGRRNRTYELWGALMFQAWSEEWLRPPPAAAGAVAVSADPATGGSQGGGR
jgi:asparagine synthase (glutamine-hydrolysing)